MKYSAHNVMHQLGNAEKIPGSDYDVIFSNSVLHWCKDKDKVFKQVASSLKEGGMFGFVVPVNFSVAEHFCTPADMLSPECRLHIVNQAHIPTSDELVQLASNNGFTTLISTEHVREWKFGGFYKFIEFLMTHHSVNDKDFHVNNMKRHFGDGEIVFKMPYVTTVLVNINV